MYNTAGLIPARFLILIAHFTICVTLLWNSRESVKSCLPEMITDQAYNSHHTQLVTGLSVAITMICFELFAFLIGLTMFNSTSALLSVGGHASSCVLLCYFILDSWQCGWFWWIFAFGSVLPILNDVCVVFDVLINKKY
ncbi:unnamed protein product [Brassicogethes aeneus]|uniref:Transmembrane protein 107 n=1 Tax=Brassicogethes aeneus TaxID=1431903 RepID=A0A9P0FIE9_BRAAE|nr:unnamed protein product [Brassicogethes aeneus]